MIGKMKKTRIITIAAIIAAMLAVAACVNAIIANSITITSQTSNGKFSLDCSFTINQTDQWESPENAMFAILVPDMWTDFDTKAVITGKIDELDAEGLVFTSVDPNVCPNPEKWGADTPKSFYDIHIGKFGNKYGDCSWHFFSTGDTGYKIPAAGVATLQVHVDYPTGPQVITFEVGVGLMSYYDGPHYWFYPWDDDANCAVYHVAETSALVKMTGEGEAYNFVTAPRVSTIPARITLGEIFEVNYSADAGGEHSQLAGMGKVYLCGKCELMDGTIVSVDSPVAKNLMEHVSDAQYAKYIFPVDFFGLKKGTKIKSMEVFFTNEDGTISDGPYTIKTVQ